jgi:hypothetical protein
MYAMISSFLDSGSGCAGATVGCLSGLASPLGGRDRLVRGEMGGLTEILTVDFEPKSFVFDFLPLRSSSEERRGLPAN